MLVAGLDKSFGKLSFGMSSRHHPFRTEGVSVQLREGSDEE